MNNRIIKTKWSKRPKLLDAEDIILYTKEDDWPSCHEAKEFLIANEVQYTEKDVVKNKEFLMELVNNYRLMSVPCLLYTSDAADE